MNKFVHAQTLLSEEQLEALKSKTGYAQTKDALDAAIKHYLKCEYAER